MGRIGPGVRVSASFQQIPAGSVQQQQKDVFNLGIRTFTILLGERSVCLCTCVCFVWLVHQENTGQRL